MGGGGIYGCIQPCMGRTICMYKIVKAITKNLTMTPCPGVFSEYMAGGGGGLDSFSPHEVNSSPLLMGGSTRTSHRYKQHANAHARKSNNIGEIPLQCCRSRCPRKVCVDSPLEWRISFSSKGTHVTLSDVFILS